MTEENRIRDAADAVAGLVKSVPIYQDLAQPAVREVGIVAGRMVRALLSPLRGLVWSVEHIEKALEDAVTSKLTGVAPENLQPPNPTVAVPAIQALTYTAQEPDLRELYFNLLASAIDSRTASDAHPAFVAIIKQLTPDEARLLRCLFDRLPLAVPMVNVTSADRQTRGFAEVQPLFGLVSFQASCVKPENLPQYVTNLNRLGLTDVPTDKRLTDAEYEPLLKHSTVTSWKDAIEAAGHTLRVEKRLLKLTPFGVQFGRACIAIGTHGASPPAGSQPGTATE